MTLKTDIIAWDGNSAEDIRAVYDRYKARPSFFQDLVALAEAEPLQAGATWLLKRFVETAEAMGEDAARQLFTVIPRLVGWAPRLHMLQCLPHVPIPASSRRVVEEFTRASIRDDNTFVRAWGYGGFYALARQFPEYEEEAARIMALGLTDEPPSVRARIRKVTAKGSGGK